MSKIVRKMCNQCGKIPVEAHQEKCWSCLQDMEKACTKCGLKGVKLYTVGSQIKCKSCILKIDRFIRFIDGLNEMMPNGKRLTSAEIGNRLKLSKATTSTMLTILFQLGIVDRVRRNESYKPFEYFLIEGGNGKEVELARRVEIAKPNSSNILGEISTLRAELGRVTAERDIALEENEKLRSILDKIMDGATEYLLQHRMEDVSLKSVFTQMLAQPKAVGK